MPDTGTSWPLALSANSWGPEPDGMISLPPGPKTCSKGPPGKKPVIRSTDCPASSSPAVVSRALEASSRARSVSRRSTAVTSR